MEQQSLPDLSAFPRRCETWLGARRSLACATRDVDGCVWLEPVSGRVRLLRVVPRSAPADAFARTLLEAVIEPWPGLPPGRPMRVAVDDGSWSRSLVDLLAPLGIRRVPLHDLGPLQPHLAKLERHCNRSADEGYLLDPETSPAAVARLFEEAARVRTRPAGDATPVWRIDGLGAEAVYGSMHGSAADPGAFIFLGHAAARAVLATGSAQALFYHSCLDLRYRRLAEMSARMRLDVLTHGWPTPDGMAPLLQRTDRDSLATAADILLAADVLETLRLVPEKSPTPFDGPVWLSDGRRVRVRFPIEFPDVLQDCA